MAGGIHCRPLFKESTDMGLFRKILDFLDNRLEMTICIALMSVLSVVLFIWLVYIGIAYGCKVMRHIKIDAGLYLFPKKARKYVVIIGDVIFFFFAIAIVYYSWGLEQKQIMFGQLSPAMQIPMWIPYGAPLVGFALTAIRELETIIYRIKHLKEADEDKPLDLENL